MPPHLQKKCDAQHAANRPAFFVQIAALSFFVLSMAFVQTIAAQDKPTEDRQLTAGQTVTREIKGGETQSYSVLLAQGQFLRAAVSPREVDVVAVLYGPGGEKLLTVDLLKSSGPEPVSFEVQKGGEYRLEIRAADPATIAGQYQLTSQVKTVADDSDRDRLNAERLLSEANTLRGGTRESLEKSIEKWSEAVGLLRKLGDKYWEAYALNGNASSLQRLNEPQKALALAEQALSLRKGIGDQLGEAATSIFIGTIYNARGESQKALEFYNQALPLSRALSDRTSEAMALNNIGNIYRRDEKEKALQFYNQALLLFRAIGHRIGEANVLISIGNVHRILGERQKALEYLNQALAIYRANGDRRGELVSLTEMGKVHTDMREMQKALEFYNQALPILQSLTDRRTEGDLLNSIGLAYRELHQDQKALVYLNQALDIWRTSGDRRNEARTLSGMANLYQLSGNLQKALEIYHEALPILRAGSDRLGEADVLTELMSIWNDLSKPAIAIYYGKLAVNDFQQLRSNIRGLDKELQKTYLGTVASNYRKLADLLIDQGRLPEAQQVLGMLKEEEYFDFIRGDSKEVSSLDNAADLTPKEAEWNKRYQEIADQLTTRGKEHGELRAKKSRTPEEEKLLTKLEADLRLAQEAYQKFLDQLSVEFGKSDVARQRVFQLQESQGLMEDLRELGSGAVALYSLVGEDKYRIILVTPDIQRAFEYPIKVADLNRKVAAFREVLRDPKLDPLPLSQELYKILIAPVAKDLEQAHAQTLMWSLDGVLRYLPIAALHDGKQYMVQRYRNVIFTPASNSRLKDQPTSHWTGLGLGVSKAQSGASALPNVPAELRSIIRDETPGGASTGGVVPGTVLLDEAFTAVTMKAALNRRYPLVHIASHFAFRPGNETNSALLLGDGSLMTLAEIKTSTNLFGGVELLTLSACDTATSGADADGKEVEGFGVLAQRQGAKAVVASLWPVADEGTRLLMQNFYTRRNAAVGVLKSEALRQAQLDLLKGKGSAGENSQQRQLIRDQKPKVSQPEEALFKFNAKTPYAHPYYWAPFILIGNWK